MAGDHPRSSGRVKPEHVQLPRFHMSPSWLLLCVCEKPTITTLGCRRDRCGATKRVRSGSGILDGHSWTKSWRRPEPLAFPLFSPAGPPSPDQSRLNSAVGLSAALLTVAEMGKDPWGGNRSGDMPGYIASCMYEVVVHRGVYG